jgi:zeaxanthin glucosyltransferase
MARLDGPLGLRGLIRDVAALTDMLCRELPEALRSIGADAVIADQMEAAGGLVAEHLGLPFASVATALPINRELSLPPPYLGWRYDPSEAGLSRNRGGWRVTDWLMQPVARVIEGHARSFHLPSRSRADQCLSPTLELAQAVRGLDFPRRTLSESFHYLGPFRAAREERAFELPDGDDRPLAFCSLGTLQGGRRRLLARISTACAEAGLRLVIAHGGRLPPDAGARLPGRPLLFDFVPQRSVLAQAAVAISHCGFNTVLDALACGVPILAVPLAFEQPATAARLVRSGAGLAVPRRAGSRRIARELERLLTEPSHRAAAAQLAVEIGGAGGAERAADLIERDLLGAIVPALAAAPTTAGAARGDARDGSRSGSS